MLIASYISSVIGEYLPGRGTIYFDQMLEFLRPVFPKQNIKTNITVESIHYEKKMVNLDCRCSVESELVLSGTGKVLPPNNKKQIK